MVVLEGLVNAQCRGETAHGGGIVALEKSEVATDPHGFGPYIWLGAPRRRYHGPVEPIPSFLVMTVKGPKTALMSGLSRVPRASLSC